MDEVTHICFVQSRHQISVEFTISVSIEVDVNQRQLLGFMELNGPDFYDPLKKPYGRLDNSLTICVL
jgi:hypothetical protein